MILESLCEYLRPIIQSKQPSNNAYFSRNKVQPKSASDLDETFGYSWWILWPEFQKRILEFAEHKNYLVVTDVANYYDTIDFGQLRNYIASLDHFSEIYLDFLFFVLEQLVWRPDYLPYPGRGLPQIDLDAPRLLAHSFLFEIDKFLKDRTDDHFVRWLDDIDFGCDTKNEGKIMLRNLDELLLSRGLHLNAAKTTILNSQEAFKHFQMRENRFLTIFENGLKNQIKDQNSQFKYLYTKRKILRKRFKEYIKQEPIGQWSKIIKRYFTIFGKLNDNYMEKYIFEYIYEFPELRPNIFRYLKLIGWSPERENYLKHYIVSCFDDESFFNAIQVLLTWTSDSNIKYILRMRNFVENFNIKNSMDFLGCLWLIAKFGNAKDIDIFIRTKTKFWKNNDFLARQVACLWPRMKLFETRQTVKNIIRSFGLTNANLVLENYDLISNNEIIFNEKVKLYIQAPKQDGSYPLPKLLIALSVFSGKLPKCQIDLVKKKILQSINCKITKYYISSQKQLDII